MKPFRPSAAAKIISVTTSSAAHALPTGKGQALRFYNAGSGDVYIKYGVDNTVTVDTTTGNFDICIPASAVEMGAVPPQASTGSANTYMAVKGSAASSLHVTRGEAS